MMVETISICVRVKDVKAQIYDTKKKIKLAKVPP